MDEMLREISKYSNGTTLTITWQNNEDIIEGIIDTIYETDNGIDEDDEGYQEFYVCAILIKKVICNLSNREFNIGDLFELSKMDEPTSIELEGGMCIWRNNRESGY